MASRSPRPRRTASAALLAQSAASVDAPPALLPHFDRLFAGFGALGGAPRKTVALLREAGLRRGARVIDLGCGKGATSVALALRLGARVTGVDANPSFIHAARRLARRRGLPQSRCAFVLGDMRAEARAAPKPFDAALSLGVAPIREAASLTRRLVRPGGLYAVDDVVRDPGASARGLRAALPTRAVCLALLNRRGDRVIVEWVPAPSAVRRQNASILRRLRRNAAALAREQPRLAPALRAFLTRQSEESRLLEGPLRPALWIVRRGE